MKWLPVCFLLMGLSIVSQTTCQIADFSKGKWVKFSTTKKAIYQVTGAQLKQSGISLPISSNKIQVFGFDASVLNEKVPNTVPYGNKELAILMKDGGDGIFDEKDSFLFFAAGNLKWKMSIEGNWEHQKLNYSDTCNFFLTIGENGKRINSSNYLSSSNQKIRNYQSHILWEQDSINLLNSGKLWLGQPMGQGSGKIGSVSTIINSKNIIETEPIIFNTQYVSSNYNQNAQFDLKWNDIKLRSTSIKPISGLVYDATANKLMDSFTYWSNTNNTTPVSSNLTVQYLAPFGSTGWLDFVEIHMSKQLGFGDEKYFSFSGKSDNQNYIYELSDADSTAMVWDVTSPLEPIGFQTIYQNNILSFSSKGNNDQSFFALKQSAFEPVIGIDSLPNQNILNTTDLDYIILAPNLFQGPASKLKNFHQQKNGFKVEIIDPVKIYNEFSAGVPNPIAIRNYLKYLQVQSKEKSKPFAQYLCIIGIADFNLQRTNKKAQVPSFESDASLDILSSYASDDFYAILEDGADINIPSSVDSLDIAIGRIPAKTIAEADTLVNKIIQYTQSKSKGIWQSQITWIADDGDYNLHLQDAESIISELQKKNNSWDHKKLYLDLYPANNTAGGLSYPQVENEIQQTLNNGTLILNYTGHGNYLRLTEEAVINGSSIQNWQNDGRLPLMITASCDFAPYDQPQINPIGFNALMQNNKGIIGLVAANRLVFAYSNKQINEQYIQALLVPDNNGIYNTIGKALQKAKYATWKMQGDKLNAFKFSLLGDPALKIVNEKNSIQLNLKDSLTAGTLTSIDASIITNQQINASFNGLVDFIVYDAVKEKNTVVNQPSSIKTTIATRDGILYKGKATVTSGKSTFNFILPKETSSTSGNLKIQAFAYNNLDEAMGSTDQVFVKPSNTILQSDTKGPQIISYINDTNFSNNSWVSDIANLIVLLVDTSGIQSSGNALGHDLQLIIDDDIQNALILNNFYVADIDTYKSGSIKYSLPKLSIGKHQLVIKAWDLLGNLTKDTIYLVVPDQDKLKAKDLVNKPNPMTNYTQFSFDVNIQDPSLETEFSLRNFNGQQLVNKILPSRKNSNKWVMDWDGRDQSGATIPAGFYFYTITIRSGSQFIVLSNKLIKL